ncbi:hypothetical protein BGP77_12790 [Saccharospirillum sp. MSK14-1]|nr:hypothetical protein BGP77_12790 [Saccharospirillum sp. MSK14-1]
MPWSHRLSWPALLLSLVIMGCASYQSMESSNYALQSDLVLRFEEVYTRYQGVPYVYGGSTPAGFDCSGFIKTAYREALGHTDLPRTTAQMLNGGQFVRLDQLRPGDLVFFRIAGKEQHAGIYLDNDRFMHASSSRGVTVSSLSNRYWINHYSQARRFL